MTPLFLIEDRVDVPLEAREALAMQARSLVEAAALAAVDDVELT